MANNIDLFEYSYFFDINEKKEVKEYNVVLGEEVKEFDLNFVINRLENIWPVEFNREEVIHRVEKYWKSKLIDLRLEVLDETSLILYSILDKMFNYESNFIIKKFQIRDNVKSFLEQI